MFEKIRSLIFKFDPETAHDLAIKALKTNLVPVKVKNYECLKVKFLEKEIPNRRISKKALTSSQTD